MPRNKHLPTVSKTEVLHDAYFRLEKDSLDIQEHGEYSYYTLVTAPVAVTVLAKTADGRYVLNWEYRHPIKKALLSCPGGVLAPGELPEACAARELLEETGYQAEEFETIGESYPFPGVCTQKTVYVRAKNAVDTGAHALENAEFILETALFTQSELQEQIRKAPVDGLLLSALSFEYLF